MCRGSFWPARISAADARGRRARGSAAPAWGRRFLPRPAYRFDCILFSLIQFDRIAASRLAGGHLPPTAAALGTSYPSGSRSGDLAGRRPGKEAAPSPNPDAIHRQQGIPRSAGPRRCRQRGCPEAAGQVEKSAPFLASRARLGTGMMESVVPSLPGRESWRSGSFYPKSLRVAPLQSGPGVLPWLLGPLHGGGGAVHSPQAPPRAVGEGAAFRGDEEKGRDCFSRRSRAPGHARAGTWGGGCLGGVAAEVQEAGPPKTPPQRGG